MLNYLMNTYPYSEPEETFVGDGMFHGHRVERPGLTRLLLVITATTVYSSRNPQQPTTQWSRAKNIAKRIAETAQVANQQLVLRTKVLEIEPEQDNQIVFYCVPMVDNFREGLCDRSTLTINGRKHESIIKLGSIFFGNKKEIEYGCGKTAVNNTAHGSVEQQHQTQKYQYNELKQLWVQTWMQYQAQPHGGPPSSVFTLPASSALTWPPSSAFTWTPPPRDAGTFYEIQSLIRD